MLRILVADRIAEEGLERLRQVKGLQPDIRVGLAPPDLAAIIGDYDGMIIRSGVQVTAEMLARPGKLRVIARAGVGVDNVDVPAATAAGVLVINTPDANTISTAEHAFAMMLAAARRIPAAHAHTRSGGWDRKAFVGAQLAGKTLGVIGLGRVGHAVAERALAFGMKVLAFDPFLRSETAMDGRVPVIRSLDEILPQVDFLSLHATLSDDTRNMIGAGQLSRMKKTAILVNCARGGLVDEQALAHALERGVIAAAAVDVFADEPPRASPLLAAKNAVLTPHLGASTEEAQLAVSTDAVDSMLDFLLSGTIRGAVNVAGLPPNLTERDRAYLNLTSRMAAIVSPLCREGLDRLEMAAQGSAGVINLCPTLGLAALVELMSPHIDGRLNLVNAASFARQRGIDVRHSSISGTRDFHETLTLTIHQGGESHSVEGAVFWDSRPRILAIDGYRMEMVPEGFLVLIFNDDRPGVIGQVGTIFGNAGINIADMTLSRRQKTALMVLKIDGAVSDDLLEQLRLSPAILSVRRVHLPPVQARPGANA